MLTLCALLLAAGPGALKPDRLECEYRVNPIGIDAPRPRLSWIVTSNQRDQVQTAYEIHVSRRLDIVRRGEGEVWDSGKVLGDQTLGIAYGGPLLGVGERLYWSVTAWDRNGVPSAPSKPAYWEMGMNRATWHGQWISKQDTPCPYFRKEFSVRGRVARARLYITAKGLYRVSIDGKPVGKGELTPGWTDFSKRVAYQTYDVTSLIKPGKHAIGMRLGNGWFCGHVAWTNQVYGKYPSGMAMLDVDYTDGSAGDSIRTDGTWKVSGGPVTASDLLMGETCDARLGMPGWDSPGFDDHAWKAADVTDDGNEALVAQRGPMVEKLMELKTQRVTTPKAGTYVCDLGQNMVGWARLRVDGPAGAAVTLRFAEMLNKDGTIYTANLRKAKATDTYILRGGGPEVYEPSFTFHGFRYVEVTGYPGAFTPADITGIVVGSHVRRTGSFVCSNALVNKLEHNIEWGMRGNYVDVPTDCPQRDERLGWMGDAETFAPTAAFLGDIDGFMTKWTQDVRDGQSADGAFTDVSPAVLRQEGAPAWGDAGVIVPWDVFLAYDDKQLLARNYSAMKAWVDRIDRYNSNHLWLNHRGNDYGDWLNVQDETPKDLIATAFFANSTDIVAKAAAVLGKTEDVEHYRGLWQQIQPAFASKYLDENGRIAADTQTAYVLAIEFHLASTMKQWQGAGRRLAELITVNRLGHLSTGFVGVGRLMEALTDTGHADVAYTVLLQTTYPSWLYPVTEGATTIWERWDGYRSSKGFQDPGMNSFNHYAMGAVGDWMYASVAGIGLDPEHPGYKHMIIAPQLNNGLGWAKAKLRSVYGDIESSWKVSGKHLSLDVVVPMNTTATIELPKGELMNAGVSTSGRKDGAPVTLQVGGGHYHYNVTLG
ncbi:MAG: alpha-L-rhamnosidase [Fimbriimonadaceae bacterium]